MAVSARKGQVEALVFTIIFLLIAVAVIIAAVVAVVGLRGSQVSQSVQIMAGSSRPAAFSEGLVLLKVLNTSLLEQTLQMAVTGKIPSAYGRIDLLPLSAVVQDVIRVTGFGESWRFVIANSAVRDAVPVLELGTFPTFCGDLPNPAYPDDTGNKWAWCEDYTTSDRCSPGRATYTAGQSKCRQNQRCCILLPYNFTGRKYITPAAFGTACGPDDKGWYGLCKYSCAPGEVETANSTQCQVGKNKLCCRPAERISLFEPSGLDVITIPLLYADNSRSIIGKLEIWLGEPNY